MGTYEMYPSASKKEEFHKKARKSLREVAKQFGLEKGQYDLRTNKAGIAVFGETTLHTERLYIQVGGSLPTILYRLCDGRKDYASLKYQNNFLPIDTLNNPAEIAAAARILLDRQNGWIGKRRGRLG